MSRLVRHVIPSAFILFVAGLLAACGGGGGGGGGGGNSSGNGKGAFNLGATTANFSARENGALPAPQNISITVTGSGVAQLGAAFPSGQVPTWLNVDITGSAPNYTLVLTVNSTAGPSGQRTAAVLVGTADSSGNVLKSRQVNVNYDLASNVQVSSSPSSADLVFGSSQITQALSVPVTAPNKTWTITSDVPWLQGLPAGNQQGSQTLNLSLNATGLPVNSHTGTLTVQNTADAADHASVTILLNVQAPTLTVTPTPVLLGGSDGLGSTIRNLSLTLNTGTNTYPYTVVTPDSDDIGWLRSSVPNGTVGSNPDVIVLDVDRGAITPGEYEASARFDVDVLGTTFSTTVPVTLKLESHRLVVENGVALSKFPSRQVLSRTLKVTSSRNRVAVPWRAESDQDWLTVTQPASPVVGDSLMLTADPTGLADGQHIAVVTLHSTDATIDHDEEIRVGFWVGSSDPANVQASLPAQPVALVTNPVEPLAYVHTLGDSVYVYNVYTGQLVNTFPIGGIASHTAGAMAISSDGLMLFVLETGTRVIYGLDAVTGAVKSVYNTNPNIFSQGNPVHGMSYMRPNGNPLVMTPYGETFDVESNGTLVTTTTVSPNFIGGLESLRSFNRDYSLVYALNSEISPASLVRSTLGYSALNGKELTITRGDPGVTLNGPGKDVCAGGTGSRVYVVPGGGWVSVLDPTTLGSAGNEIQPSPNAIFIITLTCARNGNLYVGSGLRTTGDDVQTFDAAGVSLGTLRAGPDFLELDQLELSGDETRFVAGYEAFNFGEYAIAFRSVPP